MPQPLASARRHYLWSSLLVERAIREASSGNAAQVVATSQIVAASRAQDASAAMLAEQRIDQAPVGRLNPASFTTDRAMFDGMLEQVKTDFELRRLVAGLVASAGRASESVATTLTPGTGFVRYLSPPSCSRCAVLAGRVYRYSDGFLRHPGCDCTMVPTSLSEPAYHPALSGLVAAGQVTDLSKASRRALANGTPAALVVKTEDSAAGLATPGGVLVRRGRPTPEGIYRSTNNREDAIQQLISAGYAAA